MGLAHVIVGAGVWHYKNSEVESTARSDPSNDTTLCSRYFKLLCFERYNRWITSGTVCNDKTVHKREEIIVVEGNL